MDFLYLLAQGTEHGAMPEWLKLILGPVGVLVLLVLYAYHTEKKRIPAVIAQIKEATAALATLRDEHKIEMDKLRDKCEVDEEKLRDSIREWRDKHTKERGVRSWWQAKAEDFAKQLGSESGIPPEIDKTYYKSDDSD